ncbi:MAG: 30S ribosomal protein S16 [Brumimicrobium sp.]
MATKIRLQRHGKKGYAFYHVVAADSRSKRDGKFIEKLGTYNPNTNPATIDINFDRTLYWVSVGAEMTDTARAILSYKGVLYKNHLIKGVKKGALTEADVEKKFEAWLKEQEAKIEKKAKGHVSAQEKAKAERLAAEKVKNEAKAKEIADANTPEPEVEESPVDEAAEEATAEATAPVEEEVKEETKEEVKVEDSAPAEEVKAEETEKKEEETPKTEEPKAEAKEDTKTDEEK